MIKTPLSTVIGGAFWTPGATVINGAKLSFEIVMKKLFANGEQGFWYDPSDMGTMFQDAAGTTAVNASGQPLGLVLDKSKGLELSAELFNDSTVQLFGATRLSPSIYRINAPDSTSVNFNIPIQGLRYNWVRIDFEVVRQGSGSARIDYSSGLSYVIPNSVGRHSIIAYCNRADNSIVFIRNTTPTDIDIKINSIKFLAGNQAYQPTSASRPILQNTPRRIDFDAIDDKLITNLPAQLTGCTVIRAVPGVGAQILTGQTIPATYEDNKDHCGLIVINRALTPSETSAIAAEFNKRAGV